MPADAPHELADATVLAGPKKIDFLGTGSVESEPCSPLIPEVLAGSSATFCPERRYYPRLPWVATTAPGQLTTLTMGEGQQRPWIATRPFVAPAASFAAKWEATTGLYALHFHLDLGRSETEAFHECSCSIASVVRENGGRGSNARR